MLDTRRAARSRVYSRLLIAAGAAAIAGCTLQEAGKTADSTSASRTSAKAFNPDTYQPPVVDSTPDDPFEAAVYRGLALVTHTRDSLPNFDTGSLNCTSCHLDEGRRPNAMPLVGVASRYPKYLERSGAVVPIEDRVNYCFTRSLGGARLPAESREMQDIVAYLAFISTGVPFGDHVRGEGMPAMIVLPSDSGRGHALFTENCARCHGANGLGMGPVPPLWGPKSFSIGASMARIERAASFIRHNMPFDRPGTLSNQQAFDIAAYITAMPRPDSPGKAADWPTGGAPADVPYETRGHAAFHPPPILPRTTSAEAAMVPVPASVLRSK
ncbi:MAG TPA: c-type cytochrome [Gemmatimonadaceae bacterium]|jgi:thiosulfate dehydrogenase|nr:c-type cytochrome [Gemmatimonadaceae bacterium]